MQQVFYDLMPSENVFRGPFPEDMTLVILVFSWDLSAKSSNLFTQSVLNTEFQGENVMAVLL